MEENRGLSEDTLEYAIDDDNIVEPDGYIDIRLGGTITFGRNNSAKVWILGQRSRRNQSKDSR